jgi:hypothetical protein
MNIAWSRLVWIALGAFMASAGPAFNMEWEARHIPDTATFGYVMKMFTLCAVEGVRAGIPALVTAVIAFFVRQDSDAKAFQLQSQRDVVLKQIRENTPSDLVFSRASKEEML